MTGNKCRRWYTIAAGLLLDSLQTGKANGYYRRLGIDSLAKLIFRSVKA
jgi:hypothetical protein